MILSLGKLHKNSIKNNVNKATAAQIKQIKQTEIGQPPFTNHISLKVKITVTVKQKEEN